MLGGGIYVTQNKTLPGSYINIVNASSVTSAVGDRGVVAIALPLNTKKNALIEVTRNDFYHNCEELLGKKHDSAELVALRELFCHATKVYVYDLGTDGDVENAIGVFEACDFNILCAYTNDAAEVKAYIDAVKSWRDELGKKCQVVVYNQDKPDSEAVINVVSTVVSPVGGATAPDYALVAWVAGAEAGCKINSSCTNMLYDGEHNIVTSKTQAELEACINNGQIAFHMVYGDVRLLEDINSLTTVTAEKGEDFKSNQTIRVIDQIANDIAKLFNTKYLGKIPNNASGRTSLWADIVAHHRQLEAVQAIEAFDSSMLTVEQGATKKSVVVNDAITVTSAMAQLYMTVVIQ